MNLVIFKQKSKHLNQVNVEQFLAVFILVLSKEGGYLNFNKLNAIKSSLENYT